MKISLDIGALDNRNAPFGTYTFTKELVSGIRLYDQKNDYHYYSLTRLNKLFGWLKLAIPFQEIISRREVFLALSQAIPLFTPANIIGFSHGLSFKYFPELYGKRAEIMDAQIRNMLKKCKYILVSSIKVKSDFKKFYKTDFKIKVVPFGIPNVFLKLTNRYKRKKIILFVGNFQKIKNLEFLINSFSKMLKLDGMSFYKFVLIGDNQEYKIQTLIPNEIRKQIIILPKMTHSEVLKYYCEAACLVSASLYESFNFPVLEALSQNTKVVATESAIIPELREYVEIAGNNQKAFAKKIQQIVQQDTTSQNQREKLIKNFNWKNYIEKLNSLFTKLNN